MGKNGKEEDFSMEVIDPWQGGARLKTSTEKSSF